MEIYSYPKNKPDYTGKFLVYYSDYEDWDVCVYDYANNEWEIDDYAVMYWAKFPKIESRKTKRLHNGTTYLQYQIEFAKQLNGVK